MKRTALLAWPILLLLLLSSYADQQLYHLGATGLAEERQQQQQQQHYLEEYGQGDLQNSDNAGKEQMGGEEQQQRAASASQDLKGQLNNLLEAAASQEVKLLTKEDIVSMVQESQAQMYGDPSRRNLQASLTTMQKLSALVEAAYTQTVQAVHASKARPNTGEEFKTDGKSLASSSANAANGQEQQSQRTVTQKPGFEQQQQQQQQHAVGPDLWVNQGLQVEGYNHAQQQAGGQGYGNHHQQDEAERHGQQHNQAGGSRHAQQPHYEAGEQGHEYGQQQQYQAGENGGYGQQHEARGHVSEGVGLGYDGGYGGYEHGGQQQYHAGDIDQHGGQQQHEKDQQQHQAGSHVSESEVKEEAIEDGYDYDDEQGESVNWQQEQQQQQQQQQQGGEVGSEHAEHGYDYDDEQGEGVNWQQEQQQEQQQDQEQQQEQPVVVKRLDLKGTGLDDAATLAFQLATLQAAGVLPEAWQPQYSGTIQMRLLAAANTGNTAALLSLADRYFMGLEVPRSPYLALQYANLAARQIAADVERDMKYTAAPEPLDLHEKWMDAQHTGGAGNLEDAEDMVDLEEDMAQRGSYAAQRRMAYRRLMGRGVDADPEAAFQDFQAGAAQGDPYAIFNLGYMYLRGMHVPQNTTKASQHFRAAAEKGLPAGWNGLGVLNWNRFGGQQNMTAAYDAFMKGAEFEHSDSLFNLGMVCQFGLGTERNDTRALGYYLRADAVGHWRAPYSLAQMYASGAQGIPADWSAAERWYRKFFAEHSDWSTQLEGAGASLEEGDEWGALVQYLLVSEQGDNTAARNAAFMLQKGQGYSGPGHLDLAASLYERAMLRESPSAAVQLGYMLLDADALGLSPWEQRTRPFAISDSLGDNNIDRAVSCFMRAANMVDPEGLFLMGWVWQHGIGSRGKDNSSSGGGSVGGEPVKAREYYKRAIKAASGTRSRALAPRLALWAMHVDTWLAPMLGPHATTRAARWLGAKLGHPKHVLSAESAVPNSGVPLVPEDGRGAPSNDVNQYALHISTSDGETGSTDRQGDKPSGIFGDFLEGLHGFLDTEGMVVVLLGLLLKVVLCALYRRLQQQQQQQASVHIIMGQQVARGTGSSEGEGERDVVHDRRGEADEEGESRVSAVWGEGQVGESEREGERKAGEVGREGVLVVEGRG